MAENPVGGSSGSSSGSGMMGPFFVGRGEMYDAASAAAAAVASFEMESGIKQQQQHMDQQQKVGRIFSRWKICILHSKSTLQSYRNQ